MSSHQQWSTWHPFKVLRVHSTRLHRWENCMHLALCILVLAHENFLRAFIALSGMTPSLRAKNAKVWSAKVAVALSCNFRRIWLAVIIIQHGLSLMWKFAFKVAVVYGRTLCSRQALAVSSLRAKVFHKTQLLYATQRIDITKNGREWKFISLW